VKSGASPSLLFQPFARHAKGIHDLLDLLLADVEALFAAAIQPSVDKVSLQMCFGME
jgi:hypothetical protein